MNPLVNVIRGQEIPHAPLNIRTPYLRIPLWAAGLWWCVKAFGRLLRFVCRHWYVTGPAVVLAGLFGHVGWQGPAVLLLVVRVAEEVSGHVTLKPYPKSRAGRRTVPLPPFAVAALTDHLREFGNAAGGLLFTARTGQPLKRGTFRARVWKPALQRAGLPAALRFHDLRHSYATWLVSDGVPINDVARVLGHEQTSTTLNLYTHSTGERDRRILAAFAAYSLPPPAEDTRE